jgi:alpha-glucoside transport system substrate-binding protein
MKSTRYILLAASIVPTILILILLNLLSRSVISVYAESNPVPVINVAGTDDPSQYQPVFDDFTSRTGYPVVYTQYSDPNELRYCQSVGCPDVAFSPAPGLTKELCASNRLIDLNPVINQSVLNANYAPDWIAFGTMGTRLCGVAFNVNNKSLVWYVPQEFSNRGWITPTTWTGMLALSDQMVSSGKIPWSIGSESGVASGWPLTDWFEDIFLHKYGGEVYDDLTIHALSWTSPEVIAAVNDFAQIFGNENYQLGGKYGTLNTSFIDALYPLFESPPQAYLHRQASFAQWFIQDHFPSQVPGVDYAIFPFPNMNAGVQNAFLGGGDLVSMMKDSPGGRALLNYLITEDAADIWVANGGISPNRNVNYGLYGDSNTRKAAEWLANASTFRFDLSDLMPAELSTFFWSAIQDLVLAAPNQANMLAVLQQIENKASQFQQIISPGVATQFQYTNPAGYLTTINIPSGAVTQTLLLQHIPLDEIGVSPADQIYAGRAFGLLAFQDNIPLQHPVFSLPIQVTLTYPDPSSQGILEETLSLMYWDGSQWRTDGISVIERDPGNNHIVFSITHLTDFALFGMDTMHVFLPIINR